VDAAATAVKDIFICSSGKHLAFVCAYCAVPFLFPTQATDEWLATVATHNRDDQAAHEAGAKLMKSENKNKGTTHPTGVVVGLCNRCALTQKRGRKRATQVAKQDCRSNKLARSTHGPSLCTPGPGILSILWDAGKAAEQSALPAAEREKVCSGCRSASERAARAAKSAESPDASLGQLMSLVDVYDSLSPAALLAFEELMLKHLRTAKPTEITFAFQNGVNRRYVVAPIARRPVVGKRQLQRRAA